MTQLKDSQDYNVVHAKAASHYVSISKGKVLVVGCNTGLDCKYLIDLGARDVTGVDVVDDVGRDYSHPGVTYLQSSVEQLDIPDQTFDLVYSVATMEHVPDIEKGFAEMARVTKPGGWIYSVASPLWNSPYGHHKPDLFQEHPWIHLLHDRDEIVELSKREGITPPDGSAIEFHVDYMLNPAFFNMTPARRYTEACDSFEQFDTLRNDFDSLPNSYLPPGSSLERALLDKGFPRSELLAVTHVYIGQKMPTRGLRLRKLRKFFYSTRATLRSRI